MIVPPSILDLRVRRKERDPLRLWLPLFVLWPLILVLLLLIFAGTIVADTVLFLVGARYCSYTRLVFGCVVLLCQTRGLVVRIRSTGTDVDLTVL